MHLGIITESPRQSLPQIARAVGLKDGQAPHHFLWDAPWEVSQLRSTQLWLTKQLIGNQPMPLCIDETGDVKKGQAPDYVAKQYIGHLGKAAPLGGRRSELEECAQQLTSKIIQPYIFYCLLAP